jgi:hypothetical protein
LRDNSATDEQQDGGGKLFHTNGGFCFLIGN